MEKRSRPPRAPLAAQACEPCRRRKIRCDTRRPQCSNCRTLGIECHYATQRRKRGPKPRASMSRPGSDTTQATLSPSDSGAQIAADVGPYFPASQDDQISPIHHASPVVPVERSTRPLQVLQALNAAIYAMGLSLEQTVKECLERCLLWSFPTLPLVHPSTFTRSIPLLLPCSMHRFKASTESQPTIEDLRAFTLLTAVCALVSRRMGRGSTSLRMDALLLPFLTASRDMLYCYEDWDIDHPDSSSLVIRISQSTAYHYTGQTSRSWYLLGDALRLAMSMKLFDESSYLGISPLEARLRRNAFATIYAGDKSASFLNGMPICYYGVYPDAREADPLRWEEDWFNLLDPEDPRFHPPFENRLNKGVYLSFRVWIMAAEIMNYLAVAASLSVQPSYDASSPDSTKLGITQSYLSFCGILDTLPTWLHNPDAHIADTEEATRFQRSAFWQQRANLVITFHCLRIILLRKAIQLDLCYVFGLTNNADILALRKIEFASDLVAASESIPFEALQANGEPLIEKLRQVGVTLLEIIHQCQNRAVTSRARSLLHTLIELVAGLDSRVSDGLRPPEVS